MVGGLGKRAQTALLLGRLAGLATRRLGRGGGTALPGLIATRLAPELTAQLARQAEAGSVVVTGTNGKTTTSHLLVAMVRAGGFEAVTNHSGSNLERGIVSAYLSAGQDSAAGPPGERRRLGVLEVDEAALPALLPALRPRAALFLNLFRDQLDRYGEVDSVAEGWREMLTVDASGLTLVLNADDPAVAQLEDGARGEVVLFGVEDRAAALDRVADGVEAGGEHAADARFCPCGAPFCYEAVFLGHVGIWRCDACGCARPRPQVAAHDICAHAGGSRFVLEIAGERVDVELPLEGLYAVYNALGAAAAAHAIGIDATAIASALREAAPAFGRQETFAIEGRTLRLWLAKNPVGLNAVLRALVGDGVAAASPQSLHLLAVLNNGVQDGRDVSWIYDADLELLAGRTAGLVVSGDRAEDLALRCILAGLDVEAVQPHRASALDEALRRTPPGGRLEVIATYTAMLELRGLVATGVGAAPYWQVERNGQAEAPS